MSKTLLVALLVLACMTASASPNTHPQRVFISGHSLVDQPLPDYLASIASSLGTPIQWNRQYMVGSSIRARARGANAAMDATGWAGYRQGYNRSGEGLDVVAELRSPATVSGGPYDTLLITEQHGLLGSLVWNDTVRYLRHYHDRFIDGNAAGRTWFYESWFDLNDKSDPRRWVDYERKASPIWQCIATRINASLEAEGRSDRIASLPAGLALASLIERATQGAGVPGVTTGDVRATVDRIVNDGVHLTPLGSYYVALVSYAYLFDRSPVGAAVPPGVDSLAASALQAVAWEVVQAERAARRALPLQSCQRRVQTEFIGTYWAYVRDVYWKPDVGAARAWWRWAKHRLQWHWYLRTAASPLHLDSASSSAYWFAPP